MASKASKPASRALAKLRKKGGASRTLARLVVDDLLERDIEELVDPADVAARTMEMLQGFAAMEALEETVSERIHWWVARLEVEEGTLGDWMTGEARERFLTLLGRPVEMNPERTMELLDHEATRDLTRKVLRETLSKFARRLSTPLPVPGSELLTGIGKRAAKSAKKRLETVSSLGDGVVGAVGGKVEREMEKRIGDFVDSAVGGVLRRIAEHVADPERQEQYGKMRVAVAERVMEYTCEGVAKAMRQVDLDEVAGFVAADIREAAADERVQVWIEDIVAHEIEGEGTLRDYLERRGLVEAWCDWTASVLEERTRALAKTDAFEAWFEALIR